MGNLGWGRKAETDPFSHPNPGVCIHELPVSRRSLFWFRQWRNEKNLRCGKILRRRKSGKTRTGSCQHQRRTELAFCGERGRFPQPLFGKRWCTEPQFRARAERAGDVAYPEGREWPGVLSYQVANTPLKGEIHISWTNSLCFQFNFKNLTLPDRNVGPYSFLKQNEIKLIVYKIFIRPTLVFELYLLQALKGPFSAYFIID